MEVNGRAPELRAALLEGVPPLFSAATNGDAHGATVAIRRLLVRLRQFDPALADQLKQRIPHAADASVRSATPVSAAPRDSDSNLGLLKRITVDGAARPIVRPETGRSLDALIAEHRHAETLASSGLTPRSTALLVGPPGVGKTMACAWLAAELGLPLYQVELSGLISSYLGKTGQNLREVFDFARSNSVVVLLDEFDAVAKRRDDPADLGEVRRMVSVLLKEIEEWPGPSVLVAATNFESSLDAAVVRRFQLIVPMSVPGMTETADILLMHLSGLRPSSQVLKLAAELLAGYSGSDIRNVAVEVRRAVALQTGTTADEAMLTVLAGRASSTIARKKFARVAHVTLRASMSRLALLLGVSKATIHSYVQKEAK